MTMNSSRFLIRPMSSETNTNFRKSLLIATVALAFSTVSNSTVSNHWLPLVAASEVASKSTVALTQDAAVQEKGTAADSKQDKQDKDETAPPPRSGRKKFEQTAKRGKVVPIDPNMPAPNLPVPPAAPAAPAAPGLALDALDPNAPNQNVSITRSVSRQNINGNTTTALKTDDQKIEVEENGQGVFIKQERIYRKSDLPELEKQNPKLAEALKNIPEEADGAFLDVEIKATKKYEALSVKALEKEQPEAFKLYQQVMIAYEENVDSRQLDGFPMQGFGAADQFDQQIQQQMKEMRAQMRQQMKQFQQNGGGTFQFRF